MPLIYHPLPSFGNHFVPNSTSEKVLAAEEANRFAQAEQQDQQTPQAAGGPPGRFVVLLGNRHRRRHVKSRRDADFQRFVVVRHRSDPEFEGSNPGELGRFLVTPQAGGRSVAGYATRTGGGGQASGLFHVETTQ